MTKEKGNVKQFSYAGIDIFNLGTTELRNMIARILELKGGFTFEWEKDKKAEEDSGNSVMVSKIHKDKKCLCNGILSKCGFRA